MGKPQGKFVTSDTCTTATTVGRELCAMIDAVTEEKNMPLKLVNNQIMQTRMKPCQHHQQDICLQTLSKEMAKHMKELLDKSEALNDSDLRIHWDPDSFVMAIDKEFLLTCNYRKGKFKSISYYLN